MSIRVTPFQRIYDPSVGEDQPWYINDHCFVQDDTSLWHMFGITHTEPANPMDVKLFAHATSRELMRGQWERQPHTMHADVDLWGEIHCWAPHIVRHAGLYHMFYCAGDPDHSRYKIHLATSPDLWKWERHRANPMVVDGYDARDPMVCRHESHWIMYYTATSEPEGGFHVVASVTSDDLTHWDDKRVVFTSPDRGTVGGPCESPFVVRHGGLHYLFMCTCRPYNNTAVYVSVDPRHWDPGDQVGEIPAHAAEVVHTQDNRWFVSHCGWGQGGLHLAEMFWGSD